jgi:hyperosmotically inducible periplasmic protein
MKTRKTTLLTTAALALASTLLIAPSTLAADEGKTSTTTLEPDNTGRNVRDRDQKTLTPLDQGNSQADVDRTAQIRREILAVSSLSVNAHNVKIITNEGHVTLRGPVNSAEEKRLVGEIATKIATSEHTDNELEVLRADAVK